MSELIKHECGIAFVRLLKPLSFYQKKYGTAFYGLNKLHLMMQKQRNRGQDGAGLATIKLDVAPGKRYISRRRSSEPDALKDLFAHVYERFNKLEPKLLKDPEWLKENMPYTGEVLLGHLRYGTHGGNSLETVHPFLRQNNWKNRSIVLAGNFNMTNVDELFQELVDLGQYPKAKADTVTVLEKIGHFLDDEVLRLFNWFKPEGYTNQQISELIFEHLDIQRLLRRSSKKFDGGFAMAGLLGHGDAFVMRDKHGIRPAFYYQDDEIVAAASERPAIQTTFGTHISEIKEIKPGHALIVKCTGKVTEEPYIKAAEQKSCSFERIYFSRGTDRDIYNERKKLGELLVDPVLEAIDYDFKNTVFSFVPNTAESAFFGFTHGLETKLLEQKKNKILKHGKKLTPEKLNKIMKRQVRVEKIIVKDAKLRTFIADDSSRGELVSHVYDVTYGIVKNNKDTLVLLDDSIVRGTTLKDSIIQIVSRLKPKRIIIVSSAPQIRFPDCYGIDMSKMKNFVAFRALIELLEENGKKKLIKKAYQRCKASLDLPADKVKNEVVPLYKEFTQQEISERIAKIVTPPGIKPEVKVIYQTIENLHLACPDHSGDWYFSGNYPTPGGRKIANRAFMYFVEGIDKRAY